MFQLGVTTAKDVLPLAWQEALSIPVTELIVTNAPSGAIIAVHYAEFVANIQEEAATYQTDYKQKYFTMLEEHNLLLKKYNKLLAKK